MKRLAWFLEACLYVALSVPLAVFPLKFGEFLGILLFYLWRSRRNIAIENLRKSISSHAISVSETPEKIIRDNFRNLGRSFVEIVKIYYGAGRKIIESVEIEGAENVYKAKSEGRGILFITAHCGNWELMVAASAKLLPSSGIARKIKNPYINKFIERVRQRYGTRVIYKKGALKAVMKVLKNNESVGILMDQAVLSDEGYVIDFLERGAWTTKMPALIARKTGATVLPAFIHRTQKGHKLKIYPAVELSDAGDKETAVIEDTKKFSGFIEEYIKEHPSEWLWMHRRWKRVKS
ncbi:MAG: lysophospholipid acyltransferase family protein [Thermodesulfovibrionales bacterium]|nr:lysophospholipid acyltransferase family protein [Thermodesulfovibrionales bacterium]